MITNTETYRGLAVLLLLASVRVFSATDAPVPTVITTVSGERFIGTPGPEEPGFVHLVSATLGEVRIPQASIRTMTRGPEGAPPAAAPAVVAMPPPPAPKAGFLQSRLNLPGKFDASVGVGLMDQSGIMEQSTLSASMDVRWEVGANVLQSSMEAHRQSVHGVVVDDAFRWDLQVRHNVNPRRFWMAASFYREDSIMAVDREEILFLGAGFNLVKTPSAEVVTVVGPAYIWQEYLPPGPGRPVPPAFGDPAAVFYQSVTYTKVPRVRLGGSVLVAQSLQDQSKHLARLILSLDFALTENLSLSNSYYLMRDSLPRIGSEEHQGVLNMQLKLRL